MAKKNATTTSWESHPRPSKISEQMCGLCADLPKREFKPMHDWPAVAHFRQPEINLVHNTPSFDYGAYVKQKEAEKHPAPRKPTLWV